MNSTNRTNRLFSVLGIVIPALSLVVTMCGVCSFDMSKSYYVENQYGDTVKMWGAGIYKHDSFFKAPIFIGSDVTILVVVIPFAMFAFCKMRREQTIENLIRSFSVVSLLLYYATSIAFGVTYNVLHLVYIVLFSACFFAATLLLAQLYEIGVRQTELFSYHVTKGMNAFLLISGVSLFVAWLPDIIASFVRGTSLELIEVYTTEITYVLDMGIISPMLFVTYFLVKKKRFIGYVLLRMNFMVCVGVGIMLPMQTVFQVLSGYEVTPPVIITKVGIFVLLAGFATFFNYRLKKSVKV